MIPLRAGARTSCPRTGSLFLSRPFEKKVDIFSLSLLKYIPAVPKENTACN